MKPTFVATLCFFLFGFTIYFPLPFTHADSDDIVKDVNGNPIVSTKRYVMLPDSSTSGGELMIVKTENATCNVTVLQRHHGDGLPVKFIPKIEVLGDPIVIDIDTDLDIVFENKPECAGSSKWVMVEADDDYPTPWVAIDGIQNYYKDKKLIEGWFGFSKMPSKTGYALGFCYHSEFGEDCYWISGKKDKYGWRLVMVSGGSDHVGVFRVVFVDVDAATTGRSVV